MISGGFAGGRLTKSSHRRHLKRVYQVGNESPDLPTISFTKEDGQGIVPGHNDPVVITMILANANLHRTLVDQGSSADILFKPAFDKLGLDEKELKAYPDTLYGLGDMTIKPLRYIPLHTTFGKGENSKNLSIDFIVIDVGSAYNALIGRTTLNRLEAVVSTPHLCMKFPTPKGIAIKLLRDNSDLFTWKASDMLGIDPQLMSHKLSVHPRSRPVQQRRRKLRTEQAQVVEKQVQALLEADFIREVKYPAWLANVYVDDMLVKTKEETDLLTDLSQVFDTVRSHGMRLNPTKCTFAVEVRKFLRFMLTQRGIEANPDKYKAILEMKSPTCLKEVQQLNGRLAALSRFLAGLALRFLQLFSLLRKGCQFEWTMECEEAFREFKKFLSQPPILTRPIVGEELVLYLSVADRAISSALIREDKVGQHPVYFTSKVLQGPELKYQKLKKFAYSLVVASRRLRPYFQAHTIKVRTNQPMK
ncbi:uncharacterized protein [Arachis hypogaea]|uniref:uncharacterized protein n=1 Tax=Arachis hypogaea TaxID=3818 RepID=UPI003B225343